MRAANCGALKRSSLAVFAASAFAIASGSNAAAQERINWTDLVNVEVRGNGVEKTRGCDGCSDAGATSLQMIESNGGFAEFRAGEDSTYLVAGLASSTRGTRVEDIDFGIRLNGNGSADIVENGRYVGGDTNYRPGDVFRFEVANGRVRYLHNGNLIGTSRKRPEFPLALDVALETVGATIANARIGTGRVDEVAGFDDRQDDFGRLDRNDDFRGLERNDDFRGLDRNNDGVITRREWNGTPRAFDARDANADGRITTRELDAYDRRNGQFDNRARNGRFDDRDVVGTAGNFILVGATERWTDTGLTVRAGDAITFDADGTIQMSGERKDTANPAGSRRSAPGALVRNAPAGTLIGRIGNGAPFTIGAQRAIPRAPATGRLYLSVNDDYLEDNAGEFRVAVTINPR